MDVPQRIEVEEQGRAVVVEWEDGVVARIDAAKLRAACSCAVCREPSGAEATQRVLQKPEEIRITAAALVGGYAVNFTFAPDSHSTGIYPFDAVRDLGSP